MLTSQSWPLGGTQYSTWEPVSSREWGPWLFLPPYKGEETEAIYPTPLPTLPIPSSSTRPCTEGREGE